MQGARQRLWLWVVSACLAGCSHPRNAQDPFGITHTSPTLSPDSAPLLLNDSITVYFSAEVLPVSVTADSVTLVDAQGQAVPGSLRVGANWVTFHPLPPVTVELTDGSYRPGAAYRLMIAGSPRPDAVRAVDGRRLGAAAVYPVHIARATDRSPGLPAPLRPLASDLPFLLRAPDLPQQLPADAPRLQLSFTQPLLPGSVTAAAFEVTLLDRLPLEELLPRSVRILPPRAMPRPFDEPPGCTVEIDLGARPQRASGAEAAALNAGDQLCVQLRHGGPTLRDYAGNSPLPTTAPQFWSVVKGGSLALAEWPAAGDRIGQDDELAPTFEAPRGACLRPRIRVEVGDGSLGVFRPRRDVTLRAGEPFDRGDGQWVTSRGSEFPFLAIDIPENVTVRVEGEAPVQLLACGAVRIAGTLTVSGGAGAVLLTPYTPPPVRELANFVPVAILAAGDIEVRGRILAASPAPAGRSNLMLATVGAIDLRGLSGELPFHTVLAFEAGSPETSGGNSGSGIRGPRGQTVVYATTFTYGAAPGADFVARGRLPWRQVPADRDAGVMHLVEASPEIAVDWQSAPPDPVRKSEPDLTIGRTSRLQRVADRDAVSFAPGAFVRLQISARVVGGREPPRVNELRLCDR